MAEPKKKGSSRAAASATANTKNTSSRGKSSKNKKGKDTETQTDTSFFRAEVIMICTFAVAVFLFCSNFKICGVIGNFFRQLQLGLFGGMGFLFPILLFLGICFYLSNRGNFRAILKITGCVLCFLSLCGLLQMLFGGGRVEGQSILEYYLLSGASGRGGGLLGGLLAVAFSALLGSVGAYLLLLVLLIIGLVFVTERSFIKLLKNSSFWVYSYARDDVSRRMEEYSMQREERKEEKRRQKEEQQPVYGVDLKSTKLWELPKFEQDALPPNEEDKSKEASKDKPIDESKGKMEEEESPELVGEEEWQEPKAAEKKEESEKIDFDAAERQARAARLQRQKASEEAFKLSTEPLSKGKETRRADVFVGRINLPKPQPVEELSDVDVEKLLRMQEEERAKASVPKEEEEKPLEKPRLYAAKKIVSGQSEEERTHFAVPMQKGQVSFAAAEPSRYEPQLQPEPELEPETELELEPEPEFKKESLGLQEGNVWQPEEEKSEKKSEERAIFVPDAPKVVVTASGKRIESETNYMYKKLEDKKEFLPRKDEFEYAKPPSVPLRQQIEKKELQPQRDYVFPADNLLTAGSFQSSMVSEEEYKETAIKLQQTLQNFGVGVTVTDISCGPAVTRYELHPEQGVKVSKIVSLQDDIKLSLAAADIRIEAPIPGKSAVGIEVPNKENSIVRLRDILSSEEFRKHPSRLAFAVGKDIGGKTVVTDIAKMPHLLIAGATGSGKSVCINTLIMSILYKAAPKDVRLIMIDPKVVELSVYNGIPHLLIPVVTDPKKASAALNWAVAEMTDRYKKFADYNVRDLKGYNAKIESIADIADDTKPQKLPQIVIIVDELADLMMVAPGEVEDAICRLAQLARAAGIHLVIATQRPSVNVITGLIKANVPSRIAFAVSSGVDSRTIIDMNGAEKLLGKGDMLFYPSGIPKPIRVQGAFVSDNEVTAVVDFLNEQGMTADYSREIEAKMAGGGMDAAAADGTNERDAYFVQAGKFVIEKDKASIGMLQRVFKIGFNRAARIMDQLADAGVVGEDEGTKPRKILMSLDEFEELF